MPAPRVKTIELFPYWTDDRSALIELAAQFGDEDLDIRPAPAFASIGEMLRHIITTEEYWWHGGILGQPWEEWRPAGWANLPEAEKHAYRRNRFPTTSAVLDGLRAVHAPVETWLRELPADALCEKRHAAWGEHNTLRWMLWHLVEHEQHHRAQLALRASALGRTVPPLWPRPGVMAGTPAGGWAAEAVDILDVVPFWKPLHASTRLAVAALTDADLASTPLPRWPAVHDLVLRMVLGEYFLIARTVGGHAADGEPPLEAGLWEGERDAPSRRAAAAFPTVASLTALMDGVHHGTRRLIAGLRIQDLGRLIETPAGPETVHHALWHAREHVVYYRAQLFSVLRLAGRTPPSI